MPERKILIIDDEELIRLAFSDYLSECGYATATAADGEIGLLLARSEPFDLVLVDLRMPRVDGLEVLGSLSVVKPELPVVVVSGTGVLQDAIEAIRQGAWDYVSKPILDMSEIVVVIERVLERARLIRERNEYQYQIETFNAKLEAEVTRQTKDLQAQNRKLSLLNRISRLISHSLEIDDMLHRSLRAALDAVQADGGLIRLINPADQQLHLTVSSGLNQKGSDNIDLYMVSDDLADSVSSGGSVKFGDLKGNTHWDCYLSSLGYKSYIYVPLRSGQDYVAPQEGDETPNAVLGVLEAFSYAEQAFDIDSIELLMTIGNQIGIALARAQYAIDLHAANMKLEQANIELRRLDSLREQFIQNVAHELRTPLALVRGYIEILATGTLSAEETQSALAVAKKRVYALVDLVEEITTLQDLDSSPLNVRSVQLKELLMTAHQMSTQQANMLGVQLGVPKISGDIYSILGDFTRLAQALHQLLDNACKFSPNGGTVSIECAPSPDGKYAEISIGDQGIGIKKEEHERIFERFYQVDGSSKRKFGGTGLGLALVKQIVEAHNGEVLVHSNIDVGSTFTVRLPVS